MTTAGTWTSGSGSASSRSSTEATGNPAARIRAATRLDGDGDGELDLWIAGDVTSPAMLSPSFGESVAPSLRVDAFVDSSGDPVSAWSMAVLYADLDGRPDVLSTTLRIHAPVAVDASSGSWLEPPSPGPDGVWRGTLAPPSSASTVVLTVTMGADTLRVRPRVYVR